MSIKYYLIPANYLLFDFHKLFYEEENGIMGRILWNFNSNDPKNIETGDICYLYYSNLPDNTRRIILRGIVTDNLKYDENGQRCFEIANLETINWKNKGRNKFTYEELKERYNVNITRNKRQLKDEREGDRQLWEALESYYERDNEKLNLSELRDEIEKNLKCAFDSKDAGKKHSTFETKNGLNYFETHHFIQQNICNREIYRNDAELYDAVHDEKNLIYLCPTCHRKIHYGREDTVRKMIQKLYKDKSSFYDEKFLKYAINEGKQDILSWLYDMYNVD